MSRALSGLRPQFNIPDQFLGFITALGADSPEISSALVSMISGQNDVAVGVVFGSNLFNLASLLGLTAVIAGGIFVRRESVLLEGTVGILITAAAAALVLGDAPPVLVFGVVLVLLIPYVLLLARGQRALEHLPLPEKWKYFLLSAVSESKESARKVERTEEEDEARSEPPEKQPEQQPVSKSRLIARVLGTLAIIVLGSFGLVRSTTWLTSGWLPSHMLGTLVLAALTGIPNLYTAIGLGRRHRGSAVMTETMNSNSLNILVGLAIPSLIFGGLVTHTASGYLDTAWLFLMTLAVVGTLAIKQGLSIALGWAVIAAYLAFVVARLFLV